MEVDEDEETIKIVQLVKSQDTLLGERNSEPIVGATIKVFNLEFFKGGGQRKKLHGFTFLTYWEHACGVGNLGWMFFYLFIFYFFILTFTIKVMRLKHYSMQRTKARKVNCCCVFSGYILKPVLSGRCL